MIALINGRLQMVTVLKSVGDMRYIRTENGNLHTISYQANAVYNQSINSRGSIDMSANRLN